MAMEELSLKNVQSIQFELLIAFDKVCKEHGFRYSLGGGTLLGAVRHKGFIPWDDDIDVMMPRPDYDAFIHCCSNIATSFRMISYENTNNYYNLFAKIWDPKTVIVDDLTEIPYSIGVSLDVFPIDGLGNTKWVAYCHFFRTFLLRELLNASNWKKYFISKTHSIWMEPVRFLFYIASRHVDQKKLILRIDKINRKRSFDRSSYAGCVCGSYREKEIMQKETFDRFSSLEFEGQGFQAISDYHTYLVKHYGDYMQLPPANQRTTHHSSKAFYIETN